MKFFVSFVNNWDPLGTNKNYQLDKMLKSFDNHTVDFNEMIRALHFIREELDTLEQNNVVETKITYYMGDSQKHVLKFSTNYYTGYLMFKRID